jgi:hypothetical protein
MDCGAEYHMRDPMVSAKMREFRASPLIRGSSSIGRYYGPTLWGQLRYPNFIKRTGWRKFQHMPDLGFLALAHLDKLRKPIDGRPPYTLIKE